MQTGAAQAVRKLMDTFTGKLADLDRQDLTAFLAGTYSPQGGEIAGILKSIHDEMSKDLADATASEGEAVKIYDELMAAKTKEVNALTQVV